MWKLINDTWLNNTNYYQRSENNVIHLTSIVKHDQVELFEKRKENDTDCLFFVVKHAYYTNKCKYTSIAMHENEF